MRNVLAVVVALLALTAVACHGPDLTPAPTPIVRPSPAPTQIAVVPSPGQLPNGGGTATVFIEATAGSVGVPGVRVELSASDGSLEQTTVTTDSSGHASARWSVERTATITARAGDLVATQTLKVQPPPVVFAPDSLPPPPPTPTPTPTPPTTPPQTALLVTMASAAPSVAAGSPMTFTATVTNVQPGEAIAYYTWTFEPEQTATTTVNSRSYTYTSHGVKAPQVTAHSTLGRVGSAAGSVIVVSLLR